MLELLQLFINPAFLTLILAAGLRAGTPILYATIGEIFAEKSGVQNLGVDGMMLLGAMTAFGVSLLTQNPWLGLLGGAIAGMLLSLLHGFVSISLRGDQVVSGLALGILGGGISAMFGTPLVGRQAPTLPSFPIPVLSDIPFFGQILFQHNVMVYIGYFIVPLAWFFINHTRPGLELRTVGEHPATADVQGINVVRLRYFYTGLGGFLAGVSGANLSLAYTPSWIENMTGGAGWIAIGLVIFAGWSPLRAAFGAYMFGAIRRLPLDLQTAGWAPLVGNASMVYFLDMLPYLATIIILIFSSVEAMRKRLGAPAALGIPYVRGERGV
jgi:general nucleoside transport system permease protein